VGGEGVGREFGVQERFGVLERFGGLEKVRSSEEGVRSYRKGSEFGGRGWEF